jgi:hypothetical protein
LHWQSRVNANAPTTEPEAGVTTYCGHSCCAIADNRYHAHRELPEECDRCAWANGNEAPRPFNLGSLVAAVVARLAPEVPGLPTGAELAERVGPEVLAVCEEARTDPDLDGLTPDELRLSLAGRVVISMAFPVPVPSD